MSKVRTALALSDMHLGRDVGYLYSKDPDFNDPKFQNNADALLTFLQGFGPQDELILNGDILERISPTHSAGKIGKPIFIYQGLNDPRVPVTESEQMVETIRKNGGEVWYLLAKDEGHGLGKKSNRDYFYGAAVLFLERYLLDDRALKIGPTLLPDPGGRKQ